MNVSEVKVATQLGDFSLRPMTMFQSAFILQQAAILSNLRKSELLAMGMGFILL